MPLFWDYEQMIAEGYGPDILAEGDSWFSYWLPKGGNMLNALDRKLTPRNLGILSLAATGDEARDMLSGASRLELIEYLSAFRLKIRAILFSGGGNDIASTRMIEVLKPDCSNVNHASDCFKDGEPGRRLDQIAAAYVELINLRDRYCPQAHIISHCYDYAVPDGRGVLGSMGWLKPPMDFCKVPDDMMLRQKLVKLLIDGLAERLAAVATTHKNFHFIDTRKTLSYPDGWVNELHPASSGHSDIADKFVPYVKAALVS